MDLIYKIQNQHKVTAINIMDADKYGELCFAKAGYIIKDGEQYGIEKHTLIVLRNVSEDFVKYSKEKLKEIEGLETLDEKKTHDIIQSIKEEDERAQSGFGAIFG